MITSNEGPPTILVQLSMKIYFKCRSQQHYELVDLLCVFTSHIRQDNAVEYYPESLSTALCM